MFKFEAGQKNTVPPGLNAINAYKCIQIGLQNTTFIYNLTIFPHLLGFLFKKPVKRNTTSVKKKFNRI